ncbi:MAG TPA: glycosyltransferase, partial [Saprospiraceae bacterium]|nr:glycosyltransferase [Saprospiraceae bacterium]
MSFIMPLHNEEKVLRQKIESLINLNYPTHKIKWYFGSDASTDQTNAILSTWEDRQHVFYKNTRTGKPGMVNFLVEKAIANYAAGAEHILLFTDASVMLDSDCLINLVKHFKNPDMGLVDANMINKGVNKNNISAAESRYVSLEVKLKHWESKINRKMIGPFGGCFALRSDFFSPIPNNFLVDDFYLCMEVFRKGGHAINALDA